MEQVHEHGGGYLVTRIRAQIGEPGYIQLRESSVENDRYIRDSVVRSIRATVLVTLAAAAIIFVLGFWLLGRPLKVVVANARRIGSGDLDARIELNQHDEIGELAREMNAMCARLRDTQAAAHREAMGRISALEQLRHADRLTTVGKLASGIAHELGTPLNVAAARARMIATGESSGSSVHRNGTIIAEQVERMRSIIQQLLDFARQRKPSKFKHDLAAVVRSSLELLGALKIAQGVTLRFANEKGAVDAVVDPSHIQQVVTNLVVNAIQAQPRGGEVRVSVYPSSEVDSRTATIEVDDDGDGMNAAVAQRMFEPFFTTKDVGQGTGLGLAVVYGIVEEHGGSIAVDSTPGVGTTVRVSLPLGSS